MQRPQSVCIERKQWILGSCLCLQNHHKVKFVVPHKRHFLFQTNIWIGYIIFQRGEKRSQVHSKFSTQILRKQMRYFWHQNPDERQQCKVKDLAFTDTSSVNQVPDMNVTFETLRLCCHLGPQENIRCDSFQIVPTDFGDICCHLSPAAPSLSLPETSISSRHGNANFLAPKSRCRLILSG